MNEQPDPLEIEDDLTFGEWIESLREEAQQDDDEPSEPEQGMLDAS